MIEKLRDIVKQLNEIIAESSYEKIDDNQKKFNWICPNCPYVVCASGDLDTYHKCPDCNIGCWWSERKD